jgi:tight adherence protein C
MIYLMISFLVNLIFFKYHPRNLNIMRFKYLIREKKHYVHTLHAAADFIDIMLLHLEAGINIYHSFGHAAHCSLDENIKKYANETLLRYSIGCSFIESLQHPIGHKNNQIYDEISENIILSLQLGTSLKANLSELSMGMRIRANLRLEEIISQAPVKMVFPLVFFIFPVIFILLGSGSIQDLIRSLSF